MKTNKTRFLTMFLMLFTLFGVTAFSTNKVYASGGLSLVEQGTGRTLNLESLSELPISLDFNDSHIAMIRMPGMSWDNNGNPLTQAIKFDILGTDTAILKLSGREMLLENGKTLTLSVINNGTIRLSDSYENIEVTLTQSGTVNLELEHIVASNLTLSTGSKSTNLKDLTSLRMGYIKDSAGNFLMWNLPEIVIDNNGNAITSPISLSVTGTGTDTLWYQGQVIGLESGKTITVNLSTPHKIVFSDGTDSIEIITTQSEGVALLNLNYRPDDKEPVVSGETTFVSNVDVERDVSYFLQYLSAYDDTDGDVSETLVIIEDNYTANKRVLGNHTFTVQATDHSGNIATAVINIRVVDITKPVISGNSSIVSIGYKETYDAENFRKTLTATDNHSNLTNANIKIKSNGYIGNKTKLGTYSIVYSVQDNSANEGTFTKQVKVIDNVAPVFSGDVTIATSNNSVLTESQVREQITAYDDIDGNLTNNIVLVEDNYTGNGNRVGSYTIRYSVTDNAGNTANHTVTVIRSDSIPPTIWVQNGKSIRTTSDLPITKDIIIDILEATGQINITSSTTFSFPLDEYTGNEKVPGIYAMMVKSASTDGNESIHNLSIHVVEAEDKEDDVTRDKSTWLDANKNYLIIGAIVLIGLAVFVEKKRK